MKLLHKTVLLVLLATLPIGIGGGWLQYKIIYAGMLRDLDEQLGRRLIHLKERWDEHPDSPLQSLGLDSDVEIREVATAPSQPPVYATIIKTGIHHTRIKVRTLRATIRMPHRNYQVVLKQVYDELDKITWDISVSVVLAFLFLLGVMGVAILLISRYIWKPFYLMIDQLQTYRIDQPAAMILPRNNIREFTELRNALTSVTEYANNQFAIQRQFSENASHEIQTPLAIALANLDALLQADYLHKSELLYVSHAKEALQRLSNLSQGLLLLTKIENRQYRTEARIDVGKLLEELLSIYEEFTSYHQLNTRSLISHEVFVQGHPYLLEVLFSNLIKNAIRHNVPDGHIYIKLTDRYFNIQNTGNPLPFPVEQLFNRFVKDPGNQDSTGLGLAMVQQIASLHQMHVAYHYHPTLRLHEFQLDFNHAGLV